MYYPSFSTHGTGGVNSPPQTLTQFKSFYTSHKCKFYNSQDTANPCETLKCRFLHILQNEFDVMCTKSLFYSNQMKNQNLNRLRDYDSRVKAFDQRNIELFHNNVVRTWDPTKKKLMPLIITACGILPYTFINGKIHVLVGYESETLSYRIFCGTRDLRNDQNCLDTAIRVLCQDLYGAFCKRDQYDISKCSSYIRKYINGNPMINRYEKSGKLTCFLFPVAKFSTKEIGYAQNYHVVAKKGNDPLFERKKSEFVWVDYEALTKGKKYSIQGAEHTALLNEYDYKIVCMFKNDFKMIASSVKEKKNPFRRYVADFSGPVAKIVGNGKNEVSEVGKLKKIAEEKDMEIAILRSQIDGITNENKYAMLSMENKLMDSEQDRRRMKKIDEVRTEAYKKLEFEKKELEARYKMSVSTNKLLIQQICKLKENLPQKE